MDYDDKQNAESSKASDLNPLLQKSAENAKLKFPPKKSDIGYGLNLIMTLNYDINKFLSKIDPNDLDSKDSSVGIGELHVTLVPNISDDLKTNTNALNFIENQVKLSGILSNPLTLGKVGVFDMGSRNILYLDILEGGEEIEAIHNKLVKTLPNEPYFKNFKTHVTICRLKEKVDFHKYMQMFKDVMLTVEPKEVILKDKDDKVLLTILP